MQTYSYNTNIRNSSDDKRISFLIWIVYAILAFYLFQFFSKTILEHQAILDLAKDQYIIEKEIPSTRGLIYLSDKKNQTGYYPVAINEDRYEVLVVPKNIKDKSDAAKKLASALGLDEKNLYDSINNDKLYIPPIAKKLTKDKAKEIIDLGVDGVIITNEQIRSYPEDNLASQTIGFVDNEANGKYGLEGYYNEELTGSSGEVVAEKDILGRFISIESQTNAKNGLNIYSTIDRNIQYIVTQYLNDAIKEMSAVRGTAIVVDPKTGKILAMASNPDYNPNTFFETAKEHPDYFLNPMVSNAWEPGSIMKPIVMSSAIDLGKVEPDTTDTFGGYAVVQGYEIHNAKDRAFGTETMTEVLQNSDNIAMIWVSKKMSDEEMYKYFTNFGFGATTNIDMEGEATGTLVALDQWREINHATMAFGQGIATTPLQMVMAYAALANNGILMKPYVVDKIQKSDGEFITTAPQEVRQVVSKETAKKITDMLVSTVEKGYDIGGKIAGYRVAGKTGTAQVANPDGGYDENKYIHSFAGYFPADDPQFVVLIVLDNPTKYNFASSTVAPVFADLAKWLLNYAEIKPTQ